MKLSISELAVKILPTFFFLGLLISPLIIWPWAEIPYEIPRAWFIQRWVEGLGILGIVGGLGRLRRGGRWIFSKEKKINLPLLLLILTFVLIAILSSVIGVDLPKSLWGNYYRQDGLIILFHLIGLVIFILLFWQENFKEKTIKAISIGAFLTSLWALSWGFRLWVLGDMSVPHWENGAIGASFGNPNFLAGFLVVTLPFMMYLVVEAKSLWEKWFWRLSIVLQMIAIIGTNSWGGLLGLVFFVLGWMVLGEFRLRWKRMVWVISCLSLLGLLGFLYIRQSQNTGFVAEGRERIVRKILLGTIQRPVLGWGWANSDYAFEASDWPIVLQHDVYVDKAHSMFLEVLATTGIVGLLVYLGLIGRVGILLVGWIKKETEDYLWPKTLFLVFLLYLFHSQTNIISIGEEVIFYLILGIVGKRENKVK